MIANNGLPVSPSQSMIEFRRLFRYFGSTKAVHDISFSVARGQVFGFIGPNGAGKTTSMRILSTLELPDYGDAFIDGYSAVNDPDRVRRRLGFMPDNYGVYPNVNVREYLDFFARSYGLRGTERKKALSKVMSFTQLDKLAEKPITGLSKGMKQRLCLGRTIIHDPAVLVMDEPAAGLDPRARIELREMIRSLATEGKTILVSSHILTELAEMCDIVGIIEQGQMLAVGKVDEILQNRHGPERRSWLRVRLLEGTEMFVKWLSAQQKIIELTVDANLVAFTFLGEESEEADLLKAAIVAGHRILAFSSQNKSLEEVFLQVTKGKIQ